MVSRPRASIAKMIAYRGVESRDIRREILRRRGDLNQIDAAVAGIDRPLDDAQFATAGAGHGAGARAADFRLHAEIREFREMGGKQRFRRAGLARLVVETRDLPIAAGGDEIELRVAERQGLVVAVGRVGDVGDERAKIDAQPFVERLLRLVPVIGGERQPGGDEDQKGPDRRKSEEPRGEGGIPPRGAEFHCAPDAGRSGGAAI